jgi:hypothetical protein
VAVNNTEPLFFYCSAPGACVDGMIGVVNAVSLRARIRSSSIAHTVQNPTATFDTQLAYARNASFAFSPGETFPPEVDSSTSASSTPTAAPTSSSIAASPTASQSQTATSSSHPLSTGAIAGIAIGGAAVLLLGAALVYLCGRQRTLGELLRHHQTPAGPPSYNPGHLSISSTEAYPAKPPNFDYGGAVPGWYDRSAAETESYRSRSPPVEEARERDMMIPSNGNSGNLSPERTQSPPVKRPVPESPSRPTPISPLDEAMYVPLQTEGDRTSPGHPPANLLPNPR